MSLYEMKRDSQFFRALRSASLYMERQWIEELDTARVAGLLYSHPKYTDCIEAMKCINEGIDDFSGKKFKT